MPLSKSSQFYYICLYIVAFAIPFPYAFGSLSVVLLCAAWLLSVNFGTVLKNLGQRKLLWLPILLFALHGVSYFYSTDKQQSLMDLGKKASFVILPIVVGLGPAINKRVLERIFAAFATSISLLAVFFMLRAGIIWLNHRTTEQFFYHMLVANFDANAIYYALYTIFSISILLLYDWKEVKLFSRKPFYYLIVGIQVLFLILLSSKTLLAFFIVAVLPLFIAKNRTKRLIIPQIVVAAIFVISLCFLAFTNNPVRVRYEQILRNDDNSVWRSDDPSGKHFNNLTLRLFIWKTAFQNINEHNLYWKGCGNGDVELYQKQKLHIYDSKIDTRYNPYIWKFNLHNQFLQILMMLGVGGLVVFCLFIFIPFFYLKKIPGKSVFILFNASFLFIIFQESALQTQAGIIYYLFISSIFWQIYYNSKLSQNP